MNRASTGARGVPVSISARSIMSTSPAEKFLPESGISTFTLPGSFDITIIFVSVELSPRNRAGSPRNESENFSTFFASFPIRRVISFPVRSTRRSAS